MNRRAVGGHTVRRLLVAALVTSSMACGGPGQRLERTVEVFGPYLGSEAEAFAASMEPFERATGITVRYSGTSNFTSDVRLRLDIDRPDVAIVPQPGLIDALISSDELIPLDPATVRTVAENYAETNPLISGRYAVPYRSSSKSVVWYRPSVFSERGWAIPETLDELAGLVERIAAESAGNATMAPWCFGIEAGSATGWPASDWVEDLVLREGGPDLYDDWVTGATRFDDPAVRAAFDGFAQLVLAPRHTLGGLRSILQTDVRRAGRPLFDDPAGCAMYKQASFARAWFPDDVDIGPDADVDFFVLPGVAAGDTALLTAGDAAVQLDDRPEVDALMGYLATPAAAAEWASRGGYVSTRTSVDPSTYYRPDDQRFAELLTDPDRERRFDGSDMMPPLIGDLFLAQLTSWITGDITLDELIDTMDSARQPAR